MALLANIFYFFIVFLIVVNVHELGHFLMSKLSGVKVEEYGFGWPPRLVSRVFRGTRYSINLFLAGGFVKIFGKDLNEKGSLESANSFQKKNYLSKMSIMLGGVGFNVILAFAIFYFLFHVSDLFGNSEPGTSCTGIILYFCH